MFGFIKLELADLRRECPPGLLGPCSKPELDSLQSHKQLTLKVTGLVGSKLTKHSL